MKNNTTKLFITLFAVITMFVLTAVAAQACSIDIPENVNSGNKELVGGDSVGVLLTGREGVEGKDGAGGVRIGSENGGGLVIIRPATENAAEGETNAPADPWQTGGLPVTTTFPDAGLRVFMDAVDADKNGSISPDEATAYFEKNSGCMDLIQADVTVCDFTGVEALAEWVTALRCKPTGGVPLQLNVCGLPLLEELVCSGCGLTALELSGNPALRVLECDNNPMETLDISACPLLVDAVKNGGSFFSDESGRLPDFTEADAASHATPEMLTITYHPDNGAVRLSVPYAARLVLEAAEDPSPEENGSTEQPDVPTEQPDVPTEQPETTGGNDLCQWCGKPHNGFFGKLVSFIHSLLYSFSHLFGLK